MQIEVERKPIKVSTEDKGTLGYLIQMAEREGKTSFFFGEDELLVSDAKTIFKMLEELNGQG